MRPWAAAATLAALAGAVVGAGILAAREDAGASGLAASLPLRTPATGSGASAAPATMPAAPPSGRAEAPSAEPAVVTPESLPVAPRFRRTNTYGGNVVYVPESCRGPYDVVLHFHGAHPYVLELIEKSGVDAVVAVFNSGNGAQRYAQAFGAPGVLESLLRQVELASAPLCAGADAQPRRVALTAWSAGYAAVEKLIARQGDRERVDAVLLADGLHAGFADRWKRRFAPNALLAFRELGELAKSGEKLFAVSHSSVATGDYASTTECSRLLLKELNVPATGSFASGQAGSFSIEGSAGEDRAAHIAQFRRMDETLLGKLRERWSK